MKNVNDLKNFVNYYPNFKNCLIQTFDDSGKGDKSLARVFKIEEGWVKKCLDLNNKGAGIYFSVNGMTGDQRKKENVNYLNSWIIESDSLSKEEQLNKILKAPIKPSVIVESKKSFHIYYFCKDTKVDKQSLESWEKINKGLCDYYDGDVKIIKDTARVLRIPGFFHLKDRKNPFLIIADCLVDINKEKPFFTTEEMLKAFPAKTEKEKTNNVKNDNIILNFLNDLNSEIVLERISGTELVNFEEIEFKNNSNQTRQIFVNGKSTSCWIDNNGFIGSSDGGGPTWKQWIKWYNSGLSDKEIIKWGLQNLKDLLPEFNKPQKQEIMIPKQKYQRENFIFPKTEEEIFDDISLISGELLTIVAESNSGKTTFGLDILRANQNKNPFYINLEFKIETVFESRWLFLNGKKKKNLTIDDPLQEHEQKMLDGYVKKYLNEFSYYNAPQGIELNDLINLIIQKHKEGHKLFVIDTFSRIKGNLDNETARTNQNKAMEKLQELAQNIGIGLILLHHTNKKGLFEGSQKILDLSTMFIIIKKGEDPTVGDYRIFELIKDKYIGNKTFEVYLENKTKYRLLNY